ncbi:MAG: hypothetical protein ACO263_06260 [Cyclobacteriaceae bacterium]|jgi:hypothetical protein
MKKLFALLMVCGFAFAFVACGGGAQQEEAADSTAVETPAVEAPAQDSVAKDSAAAQ